MSKKNVSNKYEELMKLCREGERGISVMAFSPQKSISYGLNDTKFKLATGFYYFNLNEEVKIIGNVQNKDISNQDPKEVDSEKSVIIIADSRNNDKPVLFINEGEILKFNKKANIESEITVVVYWEIGNYSYLSYVLKNPINEEIIVDANFVTSSYQKDVNRVNCLRLLDISTRNKLIPLFNNVTEEEND